MLKDSMASRQPSKQVYGQKQQLSFLGTCFILVHEQKSPREIVCAARGASSSLEGCVGKDRARAANLHSRAGTGAVPPRGHHRASATTGWLSLSQPAPALACGKADATTPAVPPAKVSHACTSG